MFHMRNKLLVWFSLIAFGLLLVSCQANTGTAGEGDTAVDSRQVIGEAPTATPEPARPEPQPGPDADGDWVSDADEEKFGTDATKWDTDDDGSTDFEEIFIIGSDPVVFEGDTDEHVRKLKQISRVIQPFAISWKKCPS